MGFAFAIGVCSEALTTLSVAHPVDVWLSVQQHPPPLQVEGAPCVGLEYSAVGEELRYLRSAISEQGAKVPDENVDHVQPCDELVAGIVVLVVRVADLSAGGERFVVASVLR